MNLNKTNTENKARAYLIYALILILSVICLDIFFTSSAYPFLLHRRFQERFVQAENELMLQQDEIISLLIKSSPEQVMQKKIKELKKLATTQKMFFYVYQNDSLVIWSDNKIPEIDILPFMTDYQQFIQLSNGWYYAISRNIKNYKIVSLLLIKDNYIIKNQYLSNNFNPIFQIPGSIGVKSNIFKERYLIKNVHNVGIFSLDFSKPLSYSEINLFLVALLFAIALFMFVLAFYHFLSSLEANRKKIIAIIIFSSFLLLIYFVMRYYSFPTLLFKLSSFKRIILSLGKINILPADIFAVSFLIYITSYFLYTQLKYNLRKNIVYAFVALLFTTLFYNLVNYFFELITYHTSISFNIIELFSNGMTSLILIISFAMLFSTFLFLLDFSINNFFNSLSLKTTILISFVVIIIDLLFLLSIHYQEYFFSFLIFFLSLAIVIFIRKYRLTTFKYHHVVILVAIFSIYLVFIIFKIGNKRLQAEEIEYAQSLAIERDRVAEVLLNEIGEKIQQDTTVLKKIDNGIIDYPWLYKYIRKKYFSGYLDRYDMQLTICQPDDSVLTKPDYHIHPCFDFFDSIIHNNAELISNNFYFLKNYYGRISYFGICNYKTDNQTINIYIQLDSRFNTDVLGYPQLLLSENNMDDRLKKYSYVKYFKGKVAYQSGEFIYNTSIEKYPTFNGKFHYESFGGYDHLFYKANKDILIILSRKSLSIVDMLVSFSYLFIISFILFNIMLLLANHRNLNFNILQKGFRMRIQLAIIGILLLSLLSVAGITVYFIYQQYNQKYYKAYGEKVQSIYLELYNNLSLEPRLSYIWHSDEYGNLESFLQHLSNLFSVDIHLYSPNGRLIASSRSEIFEKGISSNIIDPVAYYQLSGNSKIEYIQNEWIGKEKYLSIYTPLVNKAGNVIAYINLPYFTQQSKLSDDISTFLLAIINVYLIFIIIAISIAVVTANKLTRPLRIIQESISQMRLGRGNVKIVYKGQDELGNLIEEYNKKVDELEHSVEMLSQVERESAWREMAKQVAHEIKNPLTPIKLSIQQLQRTFLNDKKIDPQYFQRVTHSILEQIDNLSSIASAFSSLAQMPVPNKEKINVNEVIEDVVALYQDAKVNFNLHLEPIGCFVLADKEQLRRVFINLITNSLQAFPPESIGNIAINVHQENNIMIIVEDDGNGIPEEMRNKLFQPNFTTKTSGSGLGLAICKSIIEYIGGSMHYEPVEPHGTRFIIHLPLAD
jgi:signal transduction histidine kinase